MVEVPANRPLNTPEVVLIVPTTVFTLSHVPPAGVLLKVVVPPTHILLLPVIAPGSGFTVSIAVATQPLGASI